MNALETFENEFISGVENERAGLWQQGRAMAAARDAGVPYTDVLKRACYLSGKAKSTVLSYMRTARVFPKNAVAEDLSFEHHRICAYQHDSTGWLQLALEHGWNCEELLDAIRAAKGDVTMGAPRRVVDRQEVYLFQGQTDRHMILLFDEPITLDDMDMDRRFIVSIVEVLSPRQDN